MYVKVELNMFINFPFEYIQWESLCYKKIY